jgi:hypothetical protein
MVYGKSISAWCVSFLILIGLLPGGKSKYLDKARICIWIPLMTLTSFGWIYINTTDIEYRIDNLGIENLIVLVNVFASPIVEMIGSVLAYSTAWQRYPWLVSDDQIPPPDAPLLFALVILSNFWMVPGMIKVTGTYSNVFAKIISELTTFFWVELILVSTFLVGICTSQLKRNIQMKTNIAGIIFGENIVKEFRCLKSFLSPILFVHLLVNSLTVLFSAYMWLSYRFWTGVPMMCFSFASMGYICFVVNRCYGAFQSLKENMR